MLTSPLTFSTDIAPLARAGLVPVFVDVEVDTFQIDVTRIEEMVTDATRAILVPNLAGNAPDWDAIRAIADRHGLAVIEDSCDALGATLRGTPTGTRADISVTSFSLSHIITCAGDGGMVLVDDRRGGTGRSFCAAGDDVPRSSCTAAARASATSGRTSTASATTRCSSSTSSAGTSDRPSSGAAFGVQQLKKLPVNHARRQRNFAAYTTFFARQPGVFVAPRQTDGARHGVAVLPRDDRSGRRVLPLRPAAVPRGARHRHPHRVDRQRRPPADDEGRRLPPAAGGLPNADRVMEYGMLLPCGHGLDDDDVAYVIAGIDRLPRRAANG